MFAKEIFNYADVNGDKSSESNAHAKLVMVTCIVPHA